MDPDLFVSCNALKVLLRHKSGWRSHEPATLPDAFLQKRASAEDPSGFLQSSKAGHAWEGGGAMPNINTRQSETPQEQLGDCDLALVLDGFRQITPAILGACMKSIEGNQMVHFEDKTRTSFMVTYAEQQLRSRKVVERGFVDQNEGLHVISKGQLILERRQRAVYGGTNMGTFIGPVEVENFEAEGVLKVSSAQKSELLGSGGKVLSGGNCPDAAARPRLAGDSVPVSWHPLPSAFYHELLVSFNVKPGGMVCNATESDGQFALAAITHKATKGQPGA